MSRYPQAIVPVDHVEPVPRRVRAALGSRWVLDSTAALYVWEWPFYPQFYIPVGDVDPALFTESSDTHHLSRGAVRSVTLEADGVRRERAGHRFVESKIDGLLDTVRFQWDALDAWFEEDEQVFVHPRNPYTRVDALRSTRSVRVHRDGALLAEAGSCVMVFETGLPTRYYLDRAAVDFTGLEPSPTVTACPYKGRTSAYWSLRHPEQPVADLAWSYDFPTRELLPIAGLVAFYNELVDITVDGVAEPRPRTHFVR